MITALAIMVSLIQRNELTYKPDNGPQGCASASLTLHDSKRGKDLPIRVTYPKAQGPFPLIVFSHGLGGSKDVYRPIVDYWCSWGYVCIQPTHADSISLRKRGHRANAGGTFAGWFDRPKDVSFILDDLAEISRQVPSMHIDMAKIGVGGHSYGAGTSELIGGTLPRSGEKLADPRAHALLMISPQGRGPLYGDAAWNTFKGAGMVITGSKDLPLGGAAAKTRTDPYELAPPGDKYLVWIEGAHHGFGGIVGRPFPGAGPVNDTELSWVKMVTLAFWDAYLARDGAAVKYLRSGHLPAYSKGVLTLSHK